MLLDEPSVVSVTPLRFEDTGSNTDTLDILVIGSNFRSSATFKCEFEGVDASATRLSDTELTCTIPHNRIVQNIRTNAKYFLTVEVVTTEGGTITHTTSNNRKYFSGKFQNIFIVIGGTEL